MFQRVRVLNGTLVMDEMGGVISDCGVVDASQDRNKNKDKLNEQLVCRSNTAHGIFQISLSNGVGQTLIVKGEGLQGKVDLAFHILSDPECEPISDTAIPADQARRESPQEA